MRILITGGSGLLGSALSDLLAAQGHEIFILSRSPEQLAGLPPNVRAVGWDGRTASGWADLADGAGAIVNLAGASIAGTHFLPSRWNASRKKLLRDSRLAAGAAVLEAVTQARNKPGIVLQASAIGYYGVHEDEILEEDSPAGDDFLAALCKEWEESTAPVKDIGVRQVVARFGIVLSPSGGALARVLLPYKLFVGGPFGNGRQWWSWIHLEDAAAAMMFLITNQEADGPFNITAPEPLPNKEFGKTLAKVLGRPHLIPVPGFALRAALGDVAMVVLEGQRVLPANLQEMGYNFCFARLEPALQDLVGR